jgi:hypothetical protein
MSFQCPLHSVIQILVHLLFLRTPRARRPHVFRQSLLVGSLKTDSVPVGDSRRLPCVPSGTCNTPRLMASTSQPSATCPRTAAPRSPSNGPLRHQPLVYATPTADLHFVPHIRLTCVTLPPRWGPSHASGPCPFFVDRCLRLHDRDTSIHKSYNSRTDRPCRTRR